MKSQKASNPHNRTKTEGGNTMGTDAERQDTRKAMIYDLQKIIKGVPDLDQTTVEKIFQIMDDYVCAANQK